MEGPDGARYDGTLRIGFAAEGDGESLKVVAKGGRWRGGVAPEGYIGPFDGLHTAI